MNTYRNVSNELKAFFSANSIFKILLPIDVVFLFGGLGVIVLNHLNFILGGNFFSTIGWYGFILGLLLAYANFHQMYLYVGFFAYGALQFINFVWYGIKNGSWGFYAIFTSALFLGLGYLIFKRNTVTGE